MARIQQSIDISVPVHIAYSQLTQFEDYPRFMQDVETVHQLDDTHLHWSARMAYQTMEWDSEITEQIPDRCIAWRNAGGPIDTGKVEVQALGLDQARITLTMECDPSRLPAQAGNVEDLLARQVGDDLQRLKDLIEASASAPAQASDSTQSEASLSQPDAATEDDGRYSVAAEQSFDQQSDQARRVGQMPLDFGPEEAHAAEALAKSMKQGKRGKKSKGLKQAIEQSVPPSE